MLNAKRSILLLMVMLLVFAATPFVLAQDEENDPFFDDIQLWTTFKLSGKVHDKVGVSSELETRFTKLAPPEGDNESLGLRYLHTQVGASFKVHSMFSIGFAFRFKQENKSIYSVIPEEWEDNNLEDAGDWPAWVRSFHPLLDPTFSFKLGGTKLKTRARLEIAMKENRELSEADIGYDYSLETDYYLRPKAEVTFPVNLGPFQPWASGEFFFKLTAEEDADNDDNSERMFYRIRIAGGIGGEIVDHIKLSPYFLFQTQAKTKGDDWGNIGVIGVKTEFRL
jgi:hypothetical protein